MKARFIVFRVIGLLLAIGLLFGVGFGAFRAGYARGVAESPAIAEALAQGLPEGSAVTPFQRGFGGPMMYHGYGYGYAGHPHMWGPHFGFFPLGGLLGFLFMAFLFFGLLRLVFFRRHWAWAHAHWHGHHGPEGGTPPWARGGPQQPAPDAPAAQPEKPQDENK